RPLPREREQILREPVHGRARLVELLLGELDELGPVVDQEPAQVGLGELALFEVGIDRDDAAAEEWRRPGVRPGLEPCDSLGVGESTGVHLDERLHVAVAAVRVGDPSVGTRALVDRRLVARGLLRGAPELPARVSGCAVDRLLAPPPADRPVVWTRAAAEHATAGHVAPGRTLHVL